MWKLIPTKTPSSSNAIKFHARSEVKYYINTEFPIKSSSCNQIEGIIELTMKNFYVPSSGISSNNSYVLRKMLRRGFEEAYYRHSLYDGDRAFYFKRMAFRLEDIIDDLDSMLDDNGVVKVEYCITIIRAIQICQDLFALDYAETVADYRNLMADLTREVCSECQRAMVGA